MFPKLLKLLIISAMLFFGVYHYSSAAFKINRPPTHNIGLVGHWTFDGGKVVNGVALDSSGNGNNANLISIATSTFYSTGKIGQGFNFDGTNDYASTTRINNNEITVAGWFYKDTNDFSANQANTVFGAWYWTADTQLTEGFDLRGGQYPSAGGCPTSQGYLCAGFTVVSTNGTTKTTKTSVFNIGSISKNGTTTQEWFHIAGTYNSTDGNQRLYINGVLRDTDLHVAGNTVVPLATTTAGACYMKFNIGYGCVNTGYFDGKIDDVRLYNRALSAGEIKNLYNQGVSKLNKTPTSILTNGLVGHWTFDGKNVVNGVALDSSGNGNNANLVSIATSTFYSTGKIGQGFDFDGVDDYVDIGDKSIFDFSGDFSISVWIKSVQSIVAGNYPMIINKNDDDGTRDDWAIGLYDPDDGLSFGEIYVGGIGYSVIFGNVRDGKWHHLVLHRSGSTLTAYRDGVWWNDVPAVSTAISNNYPVRFGKSNFIATPYFFNGNIDDVRVYNRALSGGEIKMLYNMGR